MTTNTRGKIIEYITRHQQARVHDLHKALLLSTAAIHRQLKKLLQAGTILRVGKPPLVFYTLPPATEAAQTQAHGSLPVDAQKIIETHFLSVTPDGKLLYGTEGFNYWATLYQKNRQTNKLAQEYITVIKEQRALFSRYGWIDATSKLETTYNDTYVNHLLFQDLYSYKTFGRTKLAKLVMYAKQIGAKPLIDEISAMAKPFIEKIIKTYSIDAVAYIPPTVPRPIQFIDEFSTQLHLPLPNIVLTKVTPGDIPIPQKTLSTVRERIVNARDSIYLKNSAETSYANILLLDDVAGSGASFNEVAKKLKAVGVGHKTIVAFALVGNIKGYEVIREI